MSTSFLACQGRLILSSVLFFREFVSWHYIVTFFFIIKLRSWTSKKENVKPYEERKFIVFEKTLLSLFASCPIRAGPAEAHQISSKLSTLWLKSTSVALTRSRVSSLKCGSASHLLKVKCLMVTYCCQPLFWFQVSTLIRRKCCFALS